MPKYRTYQGEVVETADEINSGGEGTVYNLRGRTDAIAKIYFAKNRNLERELKLQAMMKNPVRMEKDYHYLTWPTNLLYEANGGKFAGYTMPLSQADAPLIRCVSPTHRRKATALWAKGREKDLYTIAYNLALAFDVCHRNDICIGDVNESNIMVTPQGLPVIIDTDSFQVPNPGSPSNPFLCPVMTPEFTPPERTDNGDTPIKPEQDNFGLAVIIYRLLHNGIHPFNGRERAGEIPEIPNRIKSHRFAHSNYAHNQWEPDTTALEHWQKLSPRTRDLFIRALDYKDHKTGAMQGVSYRWLRRALNHKERKTNRPTAAEWMKSLGRDIDEMERLQSEPWRTISYEPSSQPAPRLKEETSPYRTESKPSANGRHLCQCSKCSCQSPAKYETCDSCAMNHEKTIAVCQCWCQCEKIRKVEFRVCYNCNRGMHNQGSRLDDVDDLPF